jgi:hypothetical protein
LMERGAFEVLIRPWSAGHALIALAPACALFSFYALGVAPGDEILVRPGFAQHALGLHHPLKTLEQRFLRLPVAYRYF